MRAFYFDKGTDIGTAKDLIRAALDDEGLALLPNYPLHSVRVSGAESVNGLPTDQINVPAAAIGGLAVEEEETA